MSKPSQEPHAGHDNAWLNAPIEKGHGVPGITLLTEQFLNTFQLFGQTSGKSSSILVVRWAAFSQPLHSTLHPRLVEYRLKAAENLLEPFKRRYAPPAAQHMAPWSC
eukprot:gnl/TRDRNA2_/TRDRNA2_137894_c0_seq1.p2 gnl/TRDRNA2_/TRDRNA2_137894_c0~~gnl/TRDRNA2_/TRDRNA2_137894_c0_seq1.p2  ORF type:complete len:107 (+),score=6.34 gnl/TRDRNA2_/TRDRNA2_137894_c0_seq1:444-764(+)